MTGRRLQFIRVAAVVALAALGLALSEVRQRGYRAQEPFGELTPSLEGQLADWIAVYRKEVPAFRLRRFKKVSEGPIKYDVIRGYMEDDPANRLHAQLYEYSPDRKRAVDPYATLELQGEGGTLVGSLDFESAVALIELRELLWKRILFCSPACGFHTAAWLSNDTFVVAGYTDHPPEKLCLAPCQHKPLLWILRLSPGTVTRYEGLSMIDYTSDDYVTQRLIEKLPGLDLSLVVKGRVLGPSLSLGAIHIIREGALNEAVTVKLDAETKLVSASGREMELREVTEGMRLIARGRRVQRDAMLAKKVLILGR